MPLNQRCLTILLVEPDPLARDVLRLALRDLAPEVVVMEAGDGVEALSQIRALKPQAALVNLLLPRVSGLDTIRQLQTRLGPGFPIVAVSALGLREIVQQAIKAGASDFAVRPCAPAQIVEKMRLAVQRAGAGTPAAAAAPRPAAAPRLSAA